MDTPSSRGEGAPLSSTPSMKPSSALPKTPYPLSAVQKSEMPTSLAKHHFNTLGIDAISSSPHNEISTDDASSSFAESDESLGIRSAFNLEGSFVQLSTVSGGQDSEGANTSNSNSVPESNNSPKQANNENEVDILDDDGVPDRGATNEDRGHHVTAPSPSPSIRSYMLEYKNEPRPPSSGGTRTPLAMSLSGLRRVDDSHSATILGDYFPDLALMSPKLEAIDEVTEEISVKDFAFTPDARSSRRETGPSSQRYPAIVQEEVEEDELNSENDDEDELVHQASLLSILSPLADRTSSSEPAPKRELDDSLFESPLVIPSASAHLNFRNGLSPIPGSSALSRSAPAVSGPATKRRPPALDFSAKRNIAGEEAKIEDILWNVSDNEEESEILAPEQEDLGPISPFFAHLSEEEDERRHHDAVASLPARRDRSGTIIHTVDNLPPVVRKIPTLVGPNALPYARCPS